MHHCNPWLPHSGMTFGLCSLLRFFPKITFHYMVFFPLVRNQCVSATFLFRCYFFSLSAILSYSVSAPFYILLFSSLLFFPPFTGLYLAFVWGRWHHFPLLSESLARAVMGNLTDTFHPSSACGISMGSHSPSLQTP